MIQGSIPSNVFCKAALPLLTLALFGSGCGPRMWTTDEQGIQHAPMNGSWRALEVTSNNEAWLAGSTGEWLHLYGTGSHSTVAHYQDAIWISPDSNLAPHYRGIAVTPHAVLGSVIASPGFIRRAEFDDAGKLKLPRTSAWMEEDSAVFMDAILAVDNSTLVAMGDPIDECLCVIRSEDEGRSWAKVPCALNGLPGVPLAKEGEAAFAASNGNLASAGDTLWMLSGGGASRVYRSLDRGQSWMVFDTPLQQGSTMTGGFSMAFADAQHGIIWGGNWEDKTGQHSRGAVTKNGGETWTLVSEGQGPGYASSIQYRPGSRGQQCVLVGKPGGIDLSHDGGQSWRHFSDSAFYTARFSPDGSWLWLAGPNNVGRVQSNLLDW